MWQGLLERWRTATAGTRRPGLKRIPRVEGLEDRLALSTASPAVAVVSATTEDSKSVTFAYDVNTPNLPATIDFGIYRSADPVFDAGDRAIGSIALPTSSIGQSIPDLDGRPAAEVGHHKLAYTVPEGLTIEPDRPYVLVVADPATAPGSADAAARTGVIHTHSIAVVTHGGIQDAKDDKLGPAWQRVMARSLKRQGYDVVIKYNWNKASRHPGKAAEQAPKVDRILNRAAATFPEGDPVNVHFIGHSEGAIVVGRAAQLLQVKQAPGIARGYIKLTMLDPHAANNDAPGHQYSIKNGLAGTTTKAVIRAFQWEAQDPIAAVPKNVDATEVFYQHTLVEYANTNHGMYNLWGQVPVRGPAHYYDLTGPGISHGGDYGVQRWYQYNVVPTLHDGGHFVDPTVLTGSHNLARGEVTTKWLSTSNIRQPTFTGTAAPGATVTLFAARSGSYGWKRMGESQADTSGNWEIMSKPLPDGRQRFFVRSAVPAFPGKPGVMVTPRLRLGAVEVHGTHPRFRQSIAKG